MSFTNSTPNLTAVEAQGARRWFILDARGQILGRLASRVAMVLRGKNRPTFSPHVDTGDFVVVVNAAEVRLTGRKLQDKTYRRHTGYPGGVRSLSAEEMLAKHPTRIVRAAVEGMLPGNRLGRRLAGKLKVYAGSEHPHEAQRPQSLSLEG